MAIVQLSALAAALVCGLAMAQEPPAPAPAHPASAPATTRKDLLAAKLPPGKVIAKVDIKEVTLGPGVKAPLHLHPCAVVGVVLEGTIAYQIEGQAVQHLRAGDAFYEPAEARVARFDNEGDVPARFTAFYLLEKEDQELIRMLGK